MIDEPENMLEEGCEALGHSKRSSSVLPINTGFLAGLKDKGFSPNITLDLGRRFAINELYIEHYMGSFTSSSLTVVNGKIFCGLHPYYMIALMRVLAKKGWSIAQVDECCLVSCYETVLGFEDEPFPNSGAVPLTHTSGAKAVMMPNLDPWSLSIVFKVANLPIQITQKDIYAEFPLRRGILVQIESMLVPGTLPEVNLDEFTFPEDIKSLFERNVNMFIKTYDKLKDYGIRNKRGILAYGPPGTGKTTMIKTLSHTYKDSVSFIVLNAIDAAEHIESISALASAIAPSILIMEDIDFVGKRDVHLLCSLLNSLDGFNERTGVLIIATTNAPEDIDEALSKRPGRFDTVVEFPVPNPEQRILALRKLLEIAKLDPVHAEEIAVKTQGYSYAHLKEIVTQLVLFSLMEQEEPQYDADNLVEIMARLPKMSNSSKGVGFRNRD